MGEGINSLSSLIPAFSPRRRRKTSPPAGGKHPNGIDCGCRAVWAYVLANFYKFFYFFVDRFFNRIKNLVVPVNINL
jgi:hypothetical protein